MWLNLYGCQAVLKKVYLLLKCMHWSTDLVCTLKWLFWTFGYSKWPYLVRFINPTIGFASPKIFLDYAPGTKPETALIKTALTGDPLYICSSKINIILIFFCRTFTPDERGIELEGRIYELKIWKYWSPFQINSRSSWQRLWSFDDFRHNWRTTTFVYSSKTTKGQAGIFANKKGWICKVQTGQKRWAILCVVESIKKVKEYWNKTLLNQPIDS